jgi:hypothetical protein
MEQSTTNQKHESKLATRLNHDEHKLNMAIEKMKITPLRAIGQRKVYIFLAFSVELGTKKKTNYNAHNNTS